MRITCVEAENYKLTVGKTYEAEESSRDFYKLLNDNNIGVRYNKRLFQVIPEQVVPAPRTEQDLVESVRIEGGIVVFTDMNDDDVEVRNVFASTVSTISCGVIQYSGLNAQMQECDRHFDLNEDDFLDIRKALFKACLQQYIIQNPNYAFRLLSTNVNGVDNGFTPDEDMLSVLTELATTTSEERVNPNSRRSIRVWVL